jgi:UDPglucose--hexose-1-phosphate uridylyltransferase
MSDIRHDRVHGTHVIIAPERLHRPHCYGDEEKKEVLKKEHCPFCEGNESMTPPEIFAIREKGALPNKKGWKTRVVPNLYKAVQIEAPYEHHYGFFERWEGYGAHELIIDTPEHHTSMTQWSESAVVQWLKTLRARVSDLRKDERIAYISLFKNEGDEAGASQEHCHTQLIGLPIVPKLLRERYQRSYEYYKHNASALLESEIVHEEASNERIVAKHGAFTAYCPYASAYPFEVMISSKRSLGQIDTLHDDTIAEIAPLLLTILKKMKKQLGCFTFNLSISTPPFQGNTFEYDILSHTDEMCRFSIRIMPRLYHLAGFEVSTGININPVAPEHAAKLLRESIDG